jgi:hypothetical protein
MEVAKRQSDPGEPLRTPQQVVQSPPGRWIQNEQIRRETRFSPCGTSASGGRRLKPLCGLSMARRKRELLIAPS